MHSELQKIIGVINFEQESNSDVKEQEVKLFWDRRKRDACMWGIFLTTSNTLFQTSTIFSAKETSGEAIRLAQIYMIGSIVSYMSIFMFFKGIIDTTYGLTLYYTIRNVIRLIDFEKTRDIMTV